MDDLEYKKKYLKYKNKYLYLTKQIGGATNKDIEICNNSTNENIKIYCDNKTICKNKNKKEACDAITDCTFYANNCYTNDGYYEDIFKKLKNKKEECNTNDYDNQTKNIIKKESINKYKKECTENLNELRNFNEIYNNCTKIRNEYYFNTPNNLYKDLISNKNKCINFNKKIKLELEQIEKENEDKIKKEYEYKIKKENEITDNQKSELLDCDYQYLYNSEIAENFDFFALDTINKNTIYNITKQLQLKSPDFSKIRNEEKDNKLYSFFNIVISQISKIFPLEIYKKNLYSDSTRFNKWCVIHIMNEILYNLKEKSFMSLDQNNSLINSGNEVDLLINIQCFVIKVNEFNIYQYGYIIKKNSRSLRK